jgi:hypothetical protein
MDFDTSRGVGLAADISSDRAPRFEDENLPPRLRETARDRAAPETGACDDRVRSNASAHLIACAPFTVLRLFTICTFWVLPLPNSIPNFLALFTLRRQEGKAQRG